MHDTSSNPSTPSSGGIPTPTDGSKADELARAMADAALFLNEPPEDVDTVLQRLAEVAARTIPDVDMASISVVAGDEISTKAATAQAARDLDQVQYDLQEGPCVDALLDPDKAEFIVNDMDHEQRWARYAPAAACAGSGRRWASRSTASGAAPGG